MLLNFTRPRHIGMMQQQLAAAFGVIGMHIVFEPHCFKFIHDAAGKVFATNKDKGVKGRAFTISNVYEHYDYNAATMLKPTQSTFNFGADFSFSNYYHLLYKKENFVELKSDAVVGIKSWRLTEGGTTQRAVARSGHGGGLGYSFRSQPHVCFCECNPCKHAAFTGTPSEHTVLPSTQQAKDRVIATNYVDTIQKGTPLASKGNLEDSTAGSSRSRPIPTETCTTRRGRSRMASALSSRNRRSFRSTSNGCAWKRAPTPTRATC